MSSCSLACLPAFLLCCFLAVPSLACPPFEFGVCQKKKHTQTHTIALSFLGHVCEQPVSPSSHFLAPTQTPVSIPPSCFVFESTKRDSSWSTPVLLQCFLFSKDRSCFHNAQLVCFVFSFALPVLLCVCLFVCLFFSGQPGTLRPHCTHGMKKTKQQ